MKKLLLTLLFGASCMLPASAAKYMTLVFAEFAAQFRARRIVNQNYVVCAF